MALSRHRPAHIELDTDSDGHAQGGPALSYDDHRRKRSLADRFREQPVLNGLLVLLCIAAIIVAVTAIGPASQSSGQTTRTATAKRGIVQSTVSGSGNVQSANQLDLGFKTSGTVTHIYVKQDQHVTEGQLLATVDPQSAEVTLEQAKATLQSAEANLVELEENEGESTSSQGASGGGASTPTASPRSTTTAPKTSTTTPASTEASKPKQSAATREANLASARAAVKSDRLTVKSDEQAVQNTKLYAPADGTIVSLSGEVGQTVSATGTTRASSNSSSSTGSSSSGLSGATGKATAASAASPSSSEGASLSGSSLMVLSNLEALQLVVALSESEIGNVHAGQIATVTIEALGGRKVAAHVVSVGQVPTSTSGAVSYDVTFGLDQGATGLKVGMSATAEVVIKQEAGINVPTSAIKAGSVTVLRDGKQVAEPVTTGLAGDSSTIVLSGLKAGETVVLPSASTTSGKSGLSSLFGSGRLRSGLGGGGLGGRGAAFPVGGGFPGGGLP